MGMKMKNSRFPSHFVVCCRRKVKEDEEVKFHQEFAIIVKKKELNIPTNRQIEIGRIN
jgi:hypothetical protein